MKTYLVKNKDTGEVISTHDTKEEARQKMIQLIADCRTGAYEIEEGAQND